MPLEDEKPSKRIFLFLLLNLGSLIYGYFCANWRHSIILFVMAIVMPFPLLANIRDAINNNKTNADHEMPSIDRSQNPLLFWFTLLLWTLLYLFCLYIPFLVLKN